MRYRILSYPVSLKNEITIPNFKTSNMLEIITIQKVYAKNNSLHSFLKSKRLNTNKNLFFIDSDSEDYSDIIMLSTRGYLFKFNDYGGRYHPVRFENPTLLYDMLKVTEKAVLSNRYPFYNETLALIRRNLGYDPCQKLF